MKAIILAAGKGTKVRPLTHSIPKPRIPIINRPVMELLVDHLRRHVVAQILVNTIYLAAEIENYFRDGSRLGVEMACSFEGHVEDGCGERD
jgi:mannose-1-phosphate guanylyltransferase